MSKRFANALNETGELSQRSRFVMPDPGGGRFFVELANGKRHDLAAVVLVGKDLSATDVLAKINSGEVDAESARSVVHKFLSQLPDYPIGGVISVESGAPELKLALVKRRASTRSRKGLPR